MIWKDRKCINPRKRVFKNMDTDEILKLEIQDDPDNIEEESTTPLNAHNLNQSQQDLLDDMSKDYTGTNITGPTVEGYGTIHKLYGNTVEEGSGEKSPSNPYTLRCVADDVNLFNKGTVALNKYLTNEGTLATVGTWSTSDYIPCQPQTQYIASGYTDLGTAPCRCYYDKDKNRISSVQHNQNAENMKFTTPANCYYFRESVFRNDLDTFKIQKGSIATPYTPFNGEGTVEIISQNGEQQSSNIVVTKPLCAVGDIRDELDYSGKITRYCDYFNKDIFYNTISLQTSSSNDSINCFVGTFEKRKLKSRNDLICNAFKNIPGDFNPTSEHFTLSGNLDTVYFFINKNTANTVEQFENYLLQNSIEFVGLLENPTTEPLDCSNKIVQYADETTVSNRDGAKIEVSLTNNKAISEVNEDIKSNEIQTITNENGTAIKYPDGIMICFHKKEFNCDFVANGTIFNADIENPFVFPQEFIGSSPVVTCNTANSVDYSFSMPYGIIRDSSRISNIRLIRFIAGGKGNLTLCYSAFGRWK